MTFFLKNFFDGFLKATEEQSRIRDQEPDPLDSDTDTVRIRIRTKLSRTHNTAKIPRYWNSTVR